MFPYSNERQAGGPKASANAAQASDAARYNSLTVHDRSAARPIDTLDAPPSTEHEHRQKEHQQGKHRRDGALQDDHRQDMLSNIHQLSPSTVVQLPARHRPGPARPEGAERTATPVLQGSQTQTAAQPLSWTSDFDMTKALWLATMRKSPGITLGPVDMSCALVACELTGDDCPVIHVSEAFQSLTGYSKHELIGHNCRLLQSPDGHVEAGTRRQFVDGSAVLKLKQGILDRYPVQQSLINYRKGGSPFLNLLTMIPIPWDSDEIKYMIGFQIDLVQSPSAISNAESGAMVVDYRRSKVVWAPPVPQSQDLGDRQHFTSDNVSAILHQIIPDGSISRFYTSSWPEIALGNLDGVVHILSLKGVFLHVSSACGSILEYDTAELLGNSIDSLCHPSDIVSVSRELKNATAEDPINMAFRIRRKRSGYMWFESHGALFQEGSARKYVILLGRERSVFSICRHDIANHGGIGDGDLWAKLSTSGAFLYVPSSARSLLRRHPDTLVGTSIQSLMHAHSRQEFDLALDSARGRTISVVKHDLLRQGRYIQAETILYPGHTASDQRASFLLAQIKLAKPAATASMSLAPAAGFGTEQLAEPASARASAGWGAGEVEKAHASNDDLFDALSTTRCSSWQFELRLLEKQNQTLAEEVAELLSRKKKRRRRRGTDNIVRGCANCHTQNTPEWRRGPSGDRDLCNRCGLQWAKQMGRISSRKPVANVDRRTESVAASTSPDTLEKKEPGETSDSDSSVSQDATPGDPAVSVPSLDAV